MSFFLRLFRAVFVFTRGTVSPLYPSLLKVYAPLTLYSPNIRLTRFVSAFETFVGLRRRRFLLGLFLVRMWLENALLLRNTPEPVLRNRFAADRRVFIFGI
jgi:hypothetical protein